MTTGVPLYLVSACASAEEFVAAFRRYADRTGLFVPIAEPLPPGRRGRIALTLNDGGVMVEGEAEIVSSSPKPAGLHGRIGMTIKFVGPDEPSKVVLAELDKSRLAMKPPAASAQPRPADVPAEPRPVPPPLGGRIDAANALAECVLIGDAATALSDGGDPNKSGLGRFVIPTIPTVGGVTRPKTPSTPPALTARLKPPTAVPPPTPALGVASKTTTLGMPAVPSTPTTDFIVGAKQRGDATSPLVMPPASPRTKSLSTPPAPRSPTPFAPLPIVRRPAGDEHAVGVDLGEIEAPPIGEEQKKTSLGIAMLSATLDPDEEESGAHIGPPPKPPGAAESPAEPSPAPSGRSGGLRVSEIMAAMPANEDWTMTPDAVVPTVLPADQKLEVAAVVEPSAGRVPTGDWTISADPNAEDGWTSPSKVENLKQQASGNRNLAVASAEALDAIEQEDKPTGIGEPLVQIDPTLMEPLQPLPAFEQAPPDPHALQMPPPYPAATGQDATIPTPLPFTAPPLAAPLLAAPLFAPPPLGPPGPTVAIPTPPPLAPPPLLPPTPPPFVTGRQSSGSIPAFPPPGLNVEALARLPRNDLTDAGTGFFRETGDLPRYPTDSVAAIDGHRRKRTLVIVMSAAVAIAAVVILVVFVFGGGNKQPKAGGVGSATAFANVGSALAPGSDGSAAAPPDASAAIPAPAPDARVAAPQICPVDVTSSPSGAEVVIDKATVLGTTPTTIQLPCGVEAKLTFRKAKYGNTSKTFIATSEVTKLAVKLSVPMFSIKVTSVPSGATITVGGKVVGITPTTVRLPAFAPSSITLSKDGFVPDTQRLAPRANNLSHHVTMKKGIKKLR